MPELVCPASSFLRGNPGQRPCLAYHGPCVGRSRSAPEWEHRLAAAQPAEESNVAIPGAKIVARIAAVLAVAGWTAAAFAAPPRPPRPAEKAAEKPGDKAADKTKAAKPDAKPEADKVPAEVQPSAGTLDQTPVGEDALRLGPFVAPPKPFPFPLLGEDKASELFVDRAGQIYRDRPYSGQVPDWNAVSPSASTGRCKVEPQALTWVGFQNNADGSRVYVQLEHTACGYVYRPDDLHVVIDLPQVTVANVNLKREILTGAFPTAVEFIKTDEIAGRGTRIVITLRDKRAYLSAHLGRYVFVDIAR